MKKAKKRGSADAPPQP